MEQRITTDLTGCENLPPPQGHKIWVQTNGCPENRIDVGRMQCFLEKKGYAIAEHYEEADLILFNACGLTRMTEEDSLQIINHLKEHKKSTARLIVYGCLPRIHPESLNSFPYAAIGSNDIEELGNLLHINGDIADNVHANDLTRRMSIKNEKGQGKGLKIFQGLSKIRSAFQEGFSFYEIVGPIMERLTDARQNRLNELANVYTPHSYCIKVSNGCLNACSYCAVRLSRGRLKSKPVDRVIEEFEEGLAKGFTNFSLLGTEVGAYGLEFGTNLASLLRKMLQISGDYKIRLRNVYPSNLIEMMPELREIFQTGKIVHLLSAAQSGNNRILKRMKRMYRIEDYKKAIRTINEEFQAIQVRTQLMVGFPGETESEFKDTLRLLDELCFDYVEVFAFQARPNTAAAKMLDKVPERVIGRRYHQLYLKSLFHNLERKRLLLKEQPCGGQTVLPLFRKAQSRVYRAAAM